MIKKIFSLAKKLIAAFLITVSTGSAAQLPEDKYQEPLNGFIRIHYHRTDGQYDKYSLWLWDEVKKPSTNWPHGATHFTGADSFGKFADVELLENAGQIGFLILNTASGDKEGGNKLLKITTQKQVWISENDDNIYDSAELKIKTELQAACITAAGKISLRFNSLAGLSATELPTRLSIKNENGDLVSVKSAQFDNAANATLTADFSLDNPPLQIIFASQSTPVSLHWKLIDELYASDSDELGCHIKNNKAIIKLWAPLAKEVNIVFFDKKNQTVTIGRKNLKKEAKGIWSGTFSTADFAGIDDLRGCYYQFEIINPGRPVKKVLDPYARSMAAVTVSADGESAGSSGDFVGKAAIVEPHKIGPQIKPVTIEGYQKREDAIIYEAHIRDFTSDPSIEKSLNYRWGSYKAFISALPYIKKLGVTHIQLLPVYAWFFGDETKMGERELEYRAKNNNYNWGYDPQNYFSPDGAYSEDPQNAELRIAELKELINAIHQAGMGVILDVVYTHMAKASFLNDIVPDYYFFKDANGNFLGDFGNNLATSHKMAEKLMIDSVKYWFMEYKIDGMRWDMMGDATADSVQKAYNAAAAINPQALFIGEGWRTFKGHLEDPELAGKGADQDWMNKTDNVGVFSDEIRNELKSGFASEGKPMFLTGGARNIETLLKNIKAQPANTPADSPGDMVQYIEAHDNLPLYDVIAQAIKKDPEINDNDREIHRRIRIGNVIILTSQGTILIHAGQEYGRSKQWKAENIPEQKFHTFLDAEDKPFKHPYFIHDSYDSSDAINMFDWAKATDGQRYPINCKTVAYTQGLIALRKSTDAFRLGSKKLIDQNVTMIEAPEIKSEDLVLAYCCRSTDGHSYYVFANADTTSRTISIKTDLTSGQILVDAETAGVTPIDKAAGITLTAGSITLEALTAVVIKK